MAGHKLAPVLDAFQSVYTSQSFGSLPHYIPLLYRFVIWFFHSTLSAVLLRKDSLAVVTFAPVVSWHSTLWFSRTVSQDTTTLKYVLYLVNLVNI